jgi:hypothetical protein
MLQPELLEVEAFFPVLVETVFFFAVVLLLDDVPVDLPLAELVDLLDLLPDFLVDAFAAKTSSAVSSVMSSTDLPSGREALVFPCFT